MNSISSVVIIFLWYLTGSCDSPIPVPREVFPICLLGSGGGLLAAEEPIEDWFVAVDAEI